MSTDNDRFEQRARDAGAALRRPAPADGVEGVRRARRGQLARRAVGGGVATCLVAVVGVIALRADGDARVSPATNPTTTAVEDGGPSTSTSSSTSSTSTTVVSETLPPADNVGEWVAVDGDTGVVNRVIPCCEDTYHDVTSPELPEQGATLPDGEYNASFEWSTDLSQPVVVTLRRYVPCAELPGGCEALNLDYGPTARFVDPTVSYRLEVRLDSSATVLYTAGGHSWRANGETFGTLLTDFTAALDEHYWPLRTSPELSDSVVAQLVDDEVGDFARLDSGYPALLLPDAPPVMLDRLSAGLMAVDCVLGVGLVVRDGTYTLVVSSPAGG